MMQPAYRLKSCSLLLASVFALGAPARGAEPEIQAKDLPRRPAVEPNDAIKTFQVKKGFRVELVAAEPLVMDPVAISFDESGRMFVVEMRDYSERRDEKLSRVRMLSDTDGDGKYDASTVFAEDLPWATAVICANGGVFVAASPDIYFFKDTNDDGVADVKRTVFTGFATNLDRVNMQALLNSFTWGLDNRIYGAGSFNAGVITSPEKPDLKPVDLRGGKGFSFDPNTLDFRAETRGSQHGLSFDQYGRAYACSNSNHLQAVMYDQRYAGKNPSYVMPPPTINIAADGPAAEVYRISPEEPWRIIRTRWRIAGIEKGTVEGGGRSAGYFTGATGATIYRGDAYGPDFVGDAFIGDAGGNLVHRKKVREQGTSLVAQRPDDEKKFEFLASTDTWFRPVQFANAPDGCLQVIDMYRETIEHPWSIAPSMKQFLDLNSGNDRGRIYRIVPENHQPRPSPNLGDAATEELVKALEHPNGWHRDTASRLLFERKDRAAIPLLEKLASESSSPVARIHALYSLQSSNALKPELIESALAHPEPHVRVHAIRLAEPFVTNEAPHVHAGLLSRVLKLASDESPIVRYQLALTMSLITGKDRLPALAEITRRNPTDRWTQMAVLNALADGAGEVFASLANDRTTLKQTAPILRQLATLVGEQNRASEINRVTQLIQALPDPSSQFAMLRSLGDGLRKKNQPLASAGDVVPPIVERAKATASDSSAPEPTRIEAIQLLALIDPAEANMVLVPLLGSDQPVTIQTAALRTIDQFVNAMPIGGLLRRWDSLPPRVRNEALVALLKRPERSLALLDAIRNGVLKPADLSSTQIQSLLAHPHDPVRALATQVLKQSLKSREDVLKAFLPALELKGDPEKGRAHYLERCASCHRAENQGHALGPDFVTVKTTGKEKILTSILDPNREVQPNYVAYEIETKAGDSLVGLITSDTDSGITLRQAYGVETNIPRSDIKRMKSQGQTLMPENLEENLTPQALADLLEYITRAN